MTELDIRVDSSTAIDKIRFSGIHRLEYIGGEKRYFLLTDGEDVMNIWFEDIPNLIKALQKAQELWATHKETTGET